MRLTTALSDPLLLPIEVVDLGDGVVTLFVRGEVDHEEAGELRAVLGEATDHGPRTVVVDLSGVRFMGSSGLGVLAAHGHRMAQDGGSLVVCGCRPAIRRAFQVTGIDEVVDVR